MSQTTQHAGDLTVSDRVSRFAVGALLLTLVFSALPTAVIAFAALASIPVVLSAMVGWCPGCAAFEALASLVSRKAETSLTATAVRKMSEYMS